MLPEHWHNLFLRDVARFKSKAAKSEKALINLIQSFDRWNLKFTSEESQAERSQETKYIDGEYWTRKFLLRK